MQPVVVVTHHQVFRTLSMTLQQ